jgi:hypothetical protein
MHHRALRWLSVSEAPRIHSRSSRIDGTRSLLRLLPLQSAALRMLPIPFRFYEMIRSQLHNSIKCTESTQGVVLFLDVSIMRLSSCSRSLVPMATTERLQGVFRGHRSARQVEGGETEGVQHHQLRTNNCQCASRECC